MARAMLVVAAIAGLPPVAVAAEVIPYDLFPGDEYRLTFVTGSFDTGPTDIAVYNGYVTLRALEVPELAALNTTWSIIGSTSAVDARDNTGTNPATSIGVPVYLTNGSDRVADNNADLWDGTLQHAIDVLPSGADSGSGKEVITGSHEDGTAGQPLGPGGTFLGLSDRTDSSWAVWVDNGVHIAHPNTNLYRIYGISGILQAPQSVSTTSGRGRVNTLAVTGDAAPNGNGILNTARDIPVVNDAGHTLFAADYAFTSGVADNAAAILHDGTAAVELVRGGIAAPDGNGVLSGLDIAALANDGSAMFYAKFVNTANGSSDDDAVVAAHNGLEIVTREGAPDPGGNGEVLVISDGDFPQLALNDNGEIAIELRHTNTVAGMSDDTSIVVGRPAALAERVRKGDDTPLLNGFHSTFQPPVINDAGEIAFVSTSIQSANPVASGGSLLVRQGVGGGVRIARSTDMSPDGNGEISNIMSTVALNNAGEVAFATSFSGTDGGIFEDGFAMMRGDGLSLNIIARTGDAAPDGNGEFSWGFNSAFRTPVINDFGEVAFKTLYRGTADGSVDDTAIVKGHVTLQGRKIVEIVRDGWRMPDQSNRFHNPGNAIDMNAAGVVAFTSGRRDSNNVTWTDAGIFLSDGIDIVQVAHVGDSLGGGIVQQLTVGDYGIKQGSLNRHGQVAFNAQIRDLQLKDAVFLYTPDLYWRGGSAGGWDDLREILGEANPAARRNWTLGLIPDAVHDVIVDRTRGTPLGMAVPMIEITGPGSDRTINRLTLREQSHLRLTGAHLNVLTSINLEGGSLHGAGELSGVVNVGGAGTLEADGLVVNGDIENFGTVAVRRDLNTFGTFNGHILNHGMTLVANDGELAATATFNGDFTNLGSLDIGANQTVEFFGDYFGPGSIANNGVVTFHGGFFPGASPLRTVVEGGGSVTLGDSSITVMELGGTARGEFHGDPAAQYDSLQLGAGGKLILGGTLRIELISHDGTAPVFMPEPGDHFVLFAAAEIMGSFDQGWELPDLGAGLRWQSSFDGQAYELAVTTVPLPAPLLLLSVCCGLLQFTCARRLKHA